MFFKFIALLCFITALSKADPFERYPPEWMLEQIDEDLKGINPSDLTDEAFHEAMRQQYFSDPGLVYYKIQGGELFLADASSDALARGEKFVANPSLLELLKGGRFTKFTFCLKQLVALCKTKPCFLPDCSFLLCLRDGPPDDVSVPVFCFSKKRSDSNAILVPDTDCLIQGKILIMQAALGGKIYPWEEKVNRAYWRGQTTGFLYITLDNYYHLPRFQLVDLSLKHPEWVDARFTRLVQGAEDLSDLFSSYMDNPKKIPEHLKYKYQISTDGSWSRAYGQLFSNSVIFKQEPEYVQWYSRALKPYEHYIPVASDFHDLIDRIKWAESHDQFAYLISQNANRFARENLSHLDMLFYIYLMLCQYSEVQKG